MHRVTPGEKGDLLMSILTEAKEANGGALVFTRTRHGADRLDQTLAGAGIRSGCIHGEISQRERERVLSQFRNGRLDVLVATDVAARGIDVPHITHVVNYDMPVCAEDYIHRIGRTGRAGRTGKALSFVTHGDTAQGCGPSKSWSASASIRTRPRGKSATRLPVSRPAARTVQWPHLRRRLGRWRAGKRRSSFRRLSIAAANRSVETKGADAASGMRRLLFRLKTSVLTSAHG